MCLQGYLRQVAALEGRSNITGLLREEDYDSHSLAGKAGKWCSGIYLHDDESQRDLDIATSHLTHYRQINWPTAVAIVSAAVVVVPVLSNAALCLCGCVGSEVPANSQERTHRHYRRYGTGTSEPLLPGWGMDSSLPCRLARMHALLNCVFCLPARRDIMSDLQGLLNSDLTGSRRDYSDHKF